MSKRESDDEINEKTKQQKLNNIEPNEIPTMDIDNQESPPAIFKLNAICCDDLFDWLSIEDLYSLSQTCKRLHRLIGLYYQENFKKTLLCRDQNLFYYSLQLNGFIPFVQSVQLKCRNKDDFEYIGTNCDSLRQIAFYKMKLTNSMIDSIKGKLDKIETIDLHENKSSTIKLYDDFVKFCPNLRRLCVKNFDSLDIEWIGHKYPKLEHFMLIEPNQMLRQNVGRFFQQNAHLQRLEIDHRFLLKSKKTIINSNLKLNVLNIHYTGNDFDDTGEDLVKMCTLLNKLFDDGFYKRLELGFEYHSVIPQNHIHQITTLRGLEKLFGFFDENIVLPAISTLRELDIYNFSRSNIKSDAIVAAFSNLRQINLCRSSIDQLLPFICRLPKLKELGIRSFGPTTFNESSKIKLDLAILNAERKKLTGACKITIYVQENVYLETKMATINLYTNHDLIEIKRFGSSNNSAKIFEDYHLIV